MDDEPHQRDDPLPVRRDRTVEVYANAYVRVYDDEVTFSSGRTGRHLRVSSAIEGQGVVLVPVSGESIALVRVYRYALHAWQWGLPRGFSHGHSVQDTAAAELTEELGAEASQLLVLGDIAPDSGLLDHTVTVVLARLERQASRPQDTEEVAAVRWLHLAELWKLVAAGAVQDGFTLAALALSVAAGRVEGPDRR